MTTFYVYNDAGENIACVLAKDINDAYREAEHATGLGRKLLSVERA